MLNTQNAFFKPMKTLKHVKHVFLNVFSVNLRILRVAHVFYTCKYVNFA